MNSAAFFAQSGIEPLPLIIDCDPGIDDALALMLAASAPERLHLLGVCCVSGNRPVDITTDNASRVLSLAGRPEVPVFRGATGPLGGGRPVWNVVHGEDGLGGVALPPGAAPQPEHAVDYLCNTLSSCPSGTLTLAAIGPLTNLAKVELRAPGLLARLRSLVIMGGAVQCPGNVTPAAEFNFFADPAAAQVVLNAGAKIALFGLDATSKAVMPPGWIAALDATGGRSAGIARAMLRAYSKHDPLLHDACPIAHLLAPTLFSGSAWRLQVNTEHGEQAGHVQASRAAPAPAAARLCGPVRPPAPIADVTFEVDVQGLLLLVQAGLERLP
jgi:purine nucleosidase